MKAFVYTKKGLVLDMKSKNENLDKITVQDIVDGVTGMILKGEFLAGSRIREAELCERFGVSRTPVREALRLLQNKGMVEYIPRCGVQVVEITKEEMNDLTQVRIVLEALVGRQAAEKITDEQVEELRQINEKFCMTDGIEAGQLDREFHTRIAEISGNKTAMRFLNDMKSRQVTASPRMRMRAERVKVSYQEHDAIIRALASHDAEMADLQTTFHFKMSRKTQMEKMEAGVNINKEK